MPDIRVMCSKGCGEPVVISSEQLAEANAGGKPIVAQHEVCPTELPAEDNPVFAVVIKVLRYPPMPKDLRDAGMSIDEWCALSDGVELTGVAGKVVAPSFSSGFASISKKLNEQWEQVGKFKDLPEEGLPT